MAEAIDDFGRALAMRSDANLHLQRAWGYFFLDSWALALRDFDAALRLGATGPDALAGRGLARVMLGQYPAAVLDAESARRHPSATAETHHNVACVFALAADRAGGDAGRKDRLALADRYRRQALEAVARTLASVPKEDRAAFWRDKIASDPALAAVRGSAEFRRFQAEFAEK
jgi:hypothetical protein